MLYRLIRRPSVKRRYAGSYSPLLKYISPSLSWKSSFVGYRAIPSSSSAAAVSQFSACTAASAFCSSSSAFDVLDAGKRYNGNRNKTSTRSSPFRGVWPLRCLSVGRYFRYCAFICRPSDFASKRFFSAFSPSGRAVLQLQHLRRYRTAQTLLFE